MKKIVLAVIAVAVVGYFINSNMVNKAEREAEKAEANRIEQAVKADVTQMTTRTNAISDWEETLSKGESFRFYPILTVELERLWLQPRPILFIGSIKDVATHDNSQYTISIERSLYGSFDYMFGTELQLSLRSEKEYVDSFLNKNPDLFKDYGFNNGVAVVARINAIKTSTILGVEGEREEVKIGVGEMLEIMYTGDVTF
jgi:type II secretory pathway pseudopilin PulG